MKMESVFYRIVVPTDFSACADDAWSLAQRVARASGAELVLLHVLVESPLYDEGPFSMDRVREVYEASRKWAAERLQAYAAKAGSTGVRVRTALRTGVPHQEIL